MDLQLPVYLYDVMTASATPRLVVTCRTAEDAQALANRLNQLRTDGALDEPDPFTVAPARTASVTIAVDPGSSVRVQGYLLDVEAIAKGFDDSQTAKGLALPADDPVVIS